MEDSLDFGGIKIPICDSQHGEKDRVIFYPDELPQDHQVLSDVLRGVFAPFKVWRSCALEYHRQGHDQQFEQLLTEIVTALDDPDIDKLYQEQDKDEYSEGIVDIFVALAAKALSNFSRAKQAPHLMPEVSTEYSRKFVEHLKSADEKQRINEYTWLIKGFFEIVQGDLRRAEDQFRYVYERATKGQAAKKKYLFGSLVGLGLVSYASQRYEVALNHFVKAVQTNPTASGSSVRLAVALCCYKLEQYDRARAAIEKCISLDAADASALTLLALVEQVTATKDRNKRQQCHANAFEYIALANAVDNTNPQALNLLANHHFHTWRSIEFSESCFLIDSSHLLVPRQATAELAVPKNLLRINKGALASTYTILATAGSVQEHLSTQQVDSLTAAGLRDLDEYSLVEVTPRIPNRLLPRDGEVATCGSLDVKDLASVEHYAHQAMVYATLPAVVAESNYILGKVAHSLRDPSLAFEFYWQALRDAPDNVLAAFGAAQILFVRKEFRASLETFDRVLMKNPDDKDTQAYVFLLKAILNHEVASFDKLREIAPGFQHEADLWLIQGQLRQKDPNEHKNALKCFINAKETIEQQMLVGTDPNLHVPPAVLSNISVLQHSLGKRSRALEYSKLALNAFNSLRKESGDNGAAQRVVFSSAELEEVFYSWSSTPLCTLTVGAEPGQFFSASLEPSLDTLTVGEEVVIGGVRHTVERVVSSTELICASPVKLAKLAEQRGLVASGQEFALHVKEPFGNFVDESITYCYNFARLLEDEGSTKAATEIYVELLKRHPSFMECYLRLSMICCDMGKFEEAAVWLSRALIVNDEEPDATLCLGDLYNRSANLDDAKRCYDKICSSNRHDSRAMLSLGNFYFSHSANSKSESQLKESYKFFHHVLNENHNNAYAANGLGMVCVKKHELDIARETFSKAREANVSTSEDICTNLAHVFLMQNRSVDAERLYQATIKNFTRTGRSLSDKPAHLNECVAFVQFKNNRHEEASRSIFRAIHLNPTNMRFWYNVAFVGHNQSSKVLSRSSSTAASIEDAKMFTALSKKVFKHLAAIQHQNPAIKPYDRKFANTNYTACSIKLQQLEQQLSIARARETVEEQEKRRRDEDHLALLQTRTEQKDTEARALAEERLQKQLLAEQKERKLQELREKWVVSVSEQAGGARGKGPKDKDREGGAASKDGKKKRKKGQQAPAEDEEGDEEDEALMRVLNSKAGSSIDFGSSGEEDSDADERAPRTLRARTAVPPPTDDLFGDSDDEADSLKAPAADPSDDDETPSAAPARKRLKKGGGAVSQSLGSSDEEGEQVSMDVDDSNASEGTSRKQQRIIDDDSD